MQKAVTVIIFNEEGLVLGVTRKDNHQNWGIPGGKVEQFDESLEIAIKRECLEETGLELYDIELLYEGEWNGVHEHTYTAKYRGEINYDREKEPALVDWIDPILLTKGSFGEYNAMILGLLNINLNREPESSIAKLRNKLSPMISYFSMKREFKQFLENGTGELANIDETKLIELMEIMNEQLNFILDGNLQEVLDLVNNNSIW